MIEAFRLDSVSPTLAERFRQAPQANRRKAARLACEKAASSVGLRDDDVALGLEALRSEALPGSSLRGRLERLVASFDDEYVQLEEEGKKAEALSCFSKARATSALVFALSEDATQLHEAIYEAIASLDDPAEFVQSVGAVLVCATRWE